MKGRHEQEMGFVIRFTCYILQSFSDQIKEDITGKLGWISRPSKLSCRIGSIPEDIVVKCVGQNIFSKQLQWKCRFVYMKANNLHMGLQEEWKSLVLEMHQ